MVILLVISIICLIVSLYLFVNSSIKLRRNKEDIPDWDNMTVEEVVDTLNESQKTALYFLVSKAVEEARQETMHQVECELNEMYKMLNTPYCGQTFKEE